MALLLSKLVGGHADVGEDEDDDGDDDDDDDYDDDGDADFIDGTHPCHLYTYHPFHPSHRHLSRPFPVHNFSHGFLFVPSHVFCSASFFPFPSRCTCRAAGFARSKWVSLA